MQNVWFVSPALFPLLVGFMIMLLGGVLCRTALKMVTVKAFTRTIGWLLSRSCLRFLASEPVVRFYAIVTLFLSMVFVNIPRIDFFLCSILFLTVFILLFYFDEALLLRRLFFLYLGGQLFLLLFFAAAPAPDPSAPAYTGDLLAIGFTLLFCGYAWAQVRRNPALRRKYRTGLTVAVAAPLLITPIFKYFLLVPLPTEGLIVAFMDYLRYFDF